ncbi:MAG: class I SAM-dependent DNA methyltransferase [Bacteroidia bacterium]|nr:class I SAM-dependent DNA methyltransferase [Bacteroidia bacterium]
MALSWNEIKDRALSFSKEWVGTSNEDADAKPFLIEFFNVFGISRKRVATFEHKVKKLGDGDGYIDLLWKGNILIEMKSRGLNLNKAYDQAAELPKFVLVSDFERFRLYDLEESNQIDFVLSELVDNVQHFGYLLGYQKKVYKEQDPANIKAAEMMGKFHDRLKEIGYDGHPLEVYLVRILFCLFAEDTSIFDKQQFQEFIEQRTHEDGSDLASRLQELFQVLNTPKSYRFTNLDEQLADFPYVNGKLFEEILPTASFDRKMRQVLIDCCVIDWSKISPAIFGSMFQSVMNPAERRNLGAHYTSETNILKLIKPLFLDELWAEFEAIKGSKNKLPEFHKKLSTLKFLDPACGCGNFLVITYRELRLLELEVLRVLHNSRQQVLDISNIILLVVDQFYGIEYEEFPARIAEVAMWLIDHQMNMRMSQEFGQYFVRLPLKKAAKIVHGNALKIEWNSIVTKDELSFILGNPPFVGKKEQNAEQKADMLSVFSNLKGTGVLDYVAAWYLKAVQYIKDTKIKVALVSTNSITQGEQVGVLWPLLFDKYGVKIHFAHRTFKWSNEAKGNAAVHCVILGFGCFDSSDKHLFEYEDIKGEAHEIKVKNINPYLVEGSEVTLQNRTSPICNVPEIIYGSFALDDGNYTLTQVEKDEIILANKDSAKFVKPFIGGRELLHSEIRYCLWLQNIEPNEIKENPRIKERVEAVKKWRSNSDRNTTKILSETPTVFAEIRQPSTNYLAFPTLSSENRKYIPIAFLDSTIIASNQLYVLPGSRLYHFGVLTSKMHMAWVKSVCGRFKSDYRYSAKIVYNNYPWPKNPTEKQLILIEEKAQAILDMRSKFPKSTLADLYAPITMPPALVKAHNELDKAVDLAYRSQPFVSEAKRMEFLFELYENYTADLFTKQKSAGKNKLKPIS